MYMEQSGDDRDMSAGTHAPATSDSFATFAAKPSRPWPVLSSLQALSKLMSYLTASHSEIFIYFFES